MQRPFLYLLQFHGSEDNCFQQLFATRTRRHMKVEFVVCFSPGSPVFLPNPKTNTSKF